LGRRDDIRCAENQDEAEGNGGGGGVSEGSRRGGEDKVAIASKGIRWFTNSAWAVP